ncbi:vacuolar protein sorting-associated protein 36 isoform X2 [Cryptomeria japonica]|uniref:vacuolar protein sorting-associated protein 36 isoform X2 n=1 Tax=Cryptomeria japonica TaxID=3369 RepID=UPI0027DA07D9|nr:vacuolar protein sorting-associated protein 36 isoform X2 [Cryptomeria japonica]
MEGTIWANLLLSVQLTTSGRPVFQAGEVECSILDAVDLEIEDNQAYPVLKSGILMLTTIRLIWMDENSRIAGSIPLPSIAQLFPPKKSLKNMFSKPRLRLLIWVSSDGRISSDSPSRAARSVGITLVLRGQVVPDAFVGRLWEILRSRAWEKDSNSVENVDKRVDGMVEGDGGSTKMRASMAGVSGILRKEQEQWEETDKSLHEAFQDLNALMSKAKDMVMLAEKMRTKLLAGSTGQSSAGNDDEMGTKQEIQDWLLSVGIASPVTKETSGALYHQQLSRQLADFVKIPLERAGGMIALVDVYCMFNRARGTELISPEDLLRACAIWERLNVSVILRRFESGVMVIQSKAQSDAELFKQELVQVRQQEPWVLRRHLQRNIFLRLRVKVSYVEMMVPMALGFILIFSRKLIQATCS